MLKRLLFFLYILNLSASYGQDLPPIIKYTSDNYSAGNQNWMISQDANNYMYFANNGGLLEFNGSNWTLYPTPNETIMRSIKVIGNRIYCGFYMDFGYWKRKPDGSLAYTSLTKKIRKKIIDDEQFWNIAQYDRWIIFQSLTQIFIYDTQTDSFNIIGSDTGMNKVFTVNNTILYQTFSSGLFEIENGRSKLISNEITFTKNKVVNIFEHDDSMLVQTQYDGFYIFKDGILTPWDIEANTLLKNNSAYSGQMLSDGSIAVGTVSNGIYILTPEGHIKYHITQNKGLSNNTVLSLFEDNDKNLWLGLDNGIDCINTNSAVHSYVDDTGFLGTVYTSSLYNGMLYIGTNQGLFYKTYKSEEDFKFIPGTKGQVWDLYQYDGTLFCGHDYGTFIVNGSSITQIFTGIGTWKFEPSPTNPNLLLQGNYMGISVLEKTPQGWKYRNMISGFNNSSRFFAVDGHDIYVSHEYKGVYRIEADADFRKAKKVIAYKSPSKGRNACLAAFNGDIFYAYKEGIFRLNKKNKQFERQEELSKLFNDNEYTSGKLIPDPSNKLWFFTKNYINFFSSGKLNADLKHNIIPIPSTLTNSMLGYENITQITPSNYLIGTTDGYYTININDIKFNRYKILLTTIVANALNDNPFNCNINNEGAFKYTENNFTFNYTIPEYSKYVSVEYQYMLEGMQQDVWSEWSTKPSINFKNLPPGDYAFKVRAKSGNSPSINTAVYTFTILKPWYATTFALIIYLILALIAAYLINRAYKNYYHSQKEKLIEENNRLLEIKELENEQELMRVKNDQLQQEFENKNRELAASTMNLIKKNELLSTIKDDLKKSGEGDRSIKSVITTINKNINENDTWDMFKEAFNNADKDFLKKIKKAHPLLTPNDLRLCAYLRLNLSSKEIAPLLNISVRSVEIKRYRLRKKMDLSHEIGLVEYILSV